MANQGSKILLRNRLQTGSRESNTRPQRLLLIKADLKFSTMPNPLDVTHLLRTLPSLLPPSTSSPLKAPTDAIAALVHTIHASLLFRLVQPALQETPGSAQEDDSIDDTASEITAVDDVEDTTEVENRLAPSWHARGEDGYAFEYRHGQSAMIFRVRVGRMGGRVQIDAMAEVGMAAGTRVLMHRTGRLIRFLSRLRIS